MKKNKLKKKYRNLQELFNDANRYMQDLIEYRNKTSDDVRYYSDFVHFKNLDKEFLYFKENAIEDPDDELPFARLVLK